MKNLFPLSRALRAVDALAILFLLLLSGIHIVVADSFLSWSIMMLVNICLIAGILGLASASRRDSSRLLTIAYDFYPVPLIFLAFKEVYVLIQSMARPDLDGVLIAIDHRLFGVHPTQWIMQFSTPVITEILQIAYVSYYFLMLTLGIELYRSQDRSRFALVIFSILYGFCLSYIGYLFVPGVGPRFTLHDFSALNTELPGLFCSEAIRDFINAGESITKGMPDAMVHAQRDVFPSGHTQMTLMVIYYAHRFRTSSRCILYVLGTLLIISTVYLRYHYVVDLLGGAVFMIFTVWSASRLIRWWATMNGPDIPPGSV